MKDKTKKNLWKVLAALGIVGGAVHILQPLNFDMLALFGNLTDVVQFVAGASTVIALIMSWE